MLTQEFPQYLREDVALSSDWLPWEFLPKKSPPKSLFIKIDYSEPQSPHTAAAPPAVWFKWLLIKNTFSPGRKNMFHSYYSLDLNVNVCNAGSELCINLTEDLAL